MIIFQSVFLVLNNTGNRIRSACKEPCPAISQNLLVLKLPSKLGSVEPGVSFWFLSDAVLLLCEMDFAGQAILSKRYWFALHWQMFIKKVPGSYIIL